MPSDGYLVHQPSERKAALREFNARCATEIVRCLKEGSFRLAFQPIVRAKTNEIVMHEALLRMQENCNSEFIVASHLIPVAERLGLIRLVDRAVMQLIMQTLNNHDDATLSMNVSAATAMDPHWYGQLLDVIHGNERVASRLTIEITETVALSDLKSTQRFVEHLRKAGCAVAIDDFGSGYTSLRNLRELPVNILKLDGTFCRGVAKNRDNGYVVRNLIDLSAKFGLKTVAEWVEAEEDAAMLRDWGVDYLQGNHMGEVSLQLPWGHGAAQARGLQESAPIASLEGQKFDFVAEESRFVFESADATHSIVTALEVPEASLKSSLDLPKEEPSQSATEQSIVAGEEPLTLDFSEIDESIARLRASMRALDTGEEEPRSHTAAESLAASHAA